jgi:hypothetical protein
VMMADKSQILARLKQVFILWQDLLASLDEAQMTTPLTPSDWTVKDIVAHMWAWQQGSVARMEAALQDRQPAYPDWWLAEDDLLRPGRYAWMGSYAIADSCLGSIEHHQEHIDDLKAWRSAHSRV